jgi:hypothetical protein
MLDDETLKEVGRYVVEFNTLEELITALAAAIFECSEWGTAEYLRKRDTRQKLDQIQEVCKILAGAHGLQESPLRRALSDQITEAKTILSERNTVIHGELTIKHGERPIVQLRKAQNSPVVVLSPGALSVLVQKISRTTDGLLTAYYDFMDAVDKARDAPAK